MSERPGASASMADRFAALPAEQRVRLLRRLVEAGRLDQIPDIVPPRDENGPVRLSPAQEDLWVYESLYPGGALNLCCAYHFDHPVDVDDLERALTIVQDRHDILRTRIAGTAGDLRIDFPPIGRFTLERLDLRAGAKPVKDATADGGTATALREALAEFARRPFDLGRDRLIRGRFITVDETRATLVLALHHIATDWWSFDVLHTEFAEAYQAVRAGTQPSREPAPIQYADFAAWQRELEAAGVFDAQLAFWREYLADLPAPLSVGGGSAPGSAAGGGSAPGGHGIEQVRFRLDRAAEAAVRGFAREHGATVYGVLMTAFAVLTYRLSGRTDFVIGTPTANRSAKGLARVIGYVMNAVPMRWRIAPTDTFADLLGRFAVDFPRILAHADVPVGRMVSALAPERVSGRSPLYQWVFMYLPRQRSIQDLERFTEPERVHTGGEHDLVGAVQDAVDGMAGTLEFRAGAYPPEVVRRWADSFTVLLAGLLAEPDAPVGEVALLDEAERHRLLVEHNDTAVEVRHGSLADLVARLAAETPHAPAVEAGDARLSYADLAERIDRLAGRLRRHLAPPVPAPAIAPGPAGTQPVVALALRRSASLLVAALASQRAGAAYLPIDPDLPADRIRYLLDDAAPVLLVTDAATAAGLPDAGVTRVLLDAPGGDAPSTVDGYPGGDAPSGGDGYPGGQTPPADPRRAGYVMYTSGSTGRPKGVVVSHTGIAGLAEALAGRLRLDAGSRILQLGSPGFDIWVGELCMALGSGGTLVIPPAGPLAGAELAAVLDRDRITGTFIPPAVLASVPPGEYPHLRTLCVGGDACPPGLVAAWARPGRRFCNAYGPTEATVVVTVSDPLSATGTAPPIGRPIVNTRVYVLDTRLRPVPVGVPGELYLAGDGVARGYLGRPGATAERFVADPHADRPGARMYRTGDRARWREDGQLDFLGRTDDQIALRGYRIEPAEVEAALTGHDAVAQAVVTRREDVAGQPRLVAYLVARQGAELPLDAIAAHAAATLPRHMVPGVLVPLKTLPTTTQGKLDRAALPAPASGPRRAPRAPRNEREEVLRVLFAEVLGDPGAGVDDGFFELGGDSIMAIQLVSRARAAGLAFTMQDVFTARTPAALAALAHATTVPPGSGGHPPRLPEEGRFPPTPMMHWWRERGGSLDTFTMSMLFPVPAGVDRAGIDSALAALVDRHGALRLRLRRDGHRDWELEVIPSGTPSTGVGPTGAPLIRVDARDLTDDELRARAHEIAAATRLSPEAGPLLAAAWFDRGPRGGRLLLTVHHLAVDGVSWHILQQDLADLLASRGEHPPRLSGTSYRRWAFLLHERAGQVTGQLPVWENALRGPEARLAPDRPAGTRRASVTVTLPADRTGPVLTVVPAAFLCGPNDVLLTALLAAVVRWRGHGTGLLVDLEGHGRQAATDDLDVSRTVGWFTSQYPVRLDAGPAAGEAFWRGGAETGRALKQVKEQLRAVPDGGLGFGLLRYLNPDTAPRLAELPGPDLRFNYLGRFPGAGAGAAELLGAVPEDAVALSHTIELDAVAEVRADGPHLVTNWSYAAGALTEDEVRALAGHWFAALGVLADHATHEGAGGATASNFPLVDLTQDQIDALRADLGDLGDLGDLDDLDDLEDLDLGDPGRAEP